MAGLIMNGSTTRRTMASRRFFIDGVQLYDRISITNQKISSCRSYLSTRELFSFHPESKYK